MPYRVEYSWDTKWERQDEGWGMRLVVFTAAFFMLFLVLVNTYWQEGREVLLKLVFPGDTEAAMSAVSGFTANLEQGIPLKAAAEAFCRELLNRAY